MAGSAAQRRSATSTKTESDAQGRETGLNESQRLDNQLCFAVYAAAHAFGRAYRNLLGRYDLTYPQYLGDFMSFFFISPLLLIFEF